jgi:WD40 repeat protein
MLPDQAAQGSFFTWSKNGEVKFWNSDGEMLKKEYLDLDENHLDGDNCENELSRMRYLPESSCFVAGDRFGLLTLIQSPDWHVAHAIRAHGAEITSIAVHDAQSLVSTCSRDRMVQLFRLEGKVFELLQTMDDHVGSVNQVLFAPNGEKLLSCSTDRSLVIRDRVLREQDGVQTPVFLSTKVLTLRGSPLSMTISTENMLNVSTMDRRVTKIDYSTGAVVDSFKVGDPESDDTVFLNSMVCCSNPEYPDGQEKWLVGFSSLDKSIRVYGEKNLGLLGRESGHTEGVSDIVLLEHSEDQLLGRQCTIVTTGLDGTIMIWKISRAISLFPSPESPERPPGLGISSYESDSGMAKQSPASLPPLRKVLTKMDITELTRASGLGSPSSPRSLSPARLKRKTSRLALSTTVEDVEDTPTKASIGSVNHGKSAKGDHVSDSRRSASPPPPPRSMSRPRKQRSQTELSKDLASRNAAERVDRSPSPPPFPIPTTPKGRQKSNNGRLRRPPSVPSDLRSQALVAAGRRQSMSQASDFGSLGMATEQASRMLRTYRKKLTNTKEETTVVDLDDLEDEVCELLKIIRQRRGRTQPSMPPITFSQQSPPARPPSAGRDSRRDQAKAATENDVEQLTVLLERANVADSPITTTTTTTTTTTPEMMMTDAKGKDAVASEA